MKAKKIMVYLQFLLMMTVGLFPLLVPAVAGALRTVAVARQPAAAR